MYLSINGDQANCSIVLLTADNIAGPYHSGGVAIYDEARVNYGPDGTRKTDRGENIFGAYGEWGYTTVGDNSERSQGHNSVVATADATRLAHLPGAAVTMQMQRQEQQLTITTDITNHGVTYHHLYEQNLGTTADVYAFLAADAAQLTVTSVEITDNTSTAITTLAADGRPAGAACYDLQGRRILQPTRGLYIVNGRKVVIK